MAYLGGAAAAGWCPPVRCSWQTLCPWQQAGPSAWQGLAETAPPSLAPGAAAGRVDVRFIECNELNVCCCCLCACLQDKVDGMVQHLASLAGAPPHMLLLGRSCAWQAASACASRRDSPTDVSEFACLPSLLLLLPLPADERLIISFAPNTLAYTILKRIGELFPGPSKVRVC